MGARILMFPSNKGPICDFCSSPSVRWRCPAKPGTIYVQGNNRADSADFWWAACDRCHDLIESGDRKGLFQRSIEQWKRHYPYRAKEIPERLVRDYVRSAHSLYFGNRTGPCEQV